MEGGALFRVRPEAAERVLKDCTELVLPKNEVGGYAYNDATNLIKELERILTKQLFEDSDNGMLGLSYTASNTINSYKANIATKKKDVIATAKAAADKQNDLNKAAGNWDSTIVEPEFTSSGTDAQDEADRINTYRLAAIGVKEGIAAGITQLIGKDNTNLILRSADGSRMKSVDEYKLHQLWTAISDGADRPAATIIRKDYVDIAGYIFDWRETTATNVERLAMLAAKASGFGIRVHDDLKAIVILANVEYAAKQSWGAEIRTAQRKIVAAFAYNHTHDAASITECLKFLAGADTARDRQLATAPVELAAMVGAAGESRGMAKLRAMIHHQPSFSSSDSSASESAYGVSDTEEEQSYRRRDRGRSSSTRGRSSNRHQRKGAKGSKTVRRSPSRSPSTSRSPTPERKLNVTNCKYCKKYKGNGFAHEPPRNIPHEKCNFNKKWKGYRPEWVCEKIGIAYKPWKAFKDE